MAKKNEELLVCDIFNNTLSPEDSTNPLYSIAVKIHTILFAKFPDILSAEYTGKDHSTRGDIKLCRNDGSTLEIELKVLKTKNSKGTLANITQDILSEQKIYKDAIGWSTWRDTNQYDHFVMEALKKIPITEDDVFNAIGEKIPVDTRLKVEQFGRVAKYLLNETATRLNIRKKQMPSILRALNSVDPNKLSLKDKTTLESVEFIIKHARQDLTGYLTDCGNKDIDTGNLAKLVTCLKCGYHTQKLLTDYMEKSIDQIEESCDNYNILYYYPKSDSYVFEDKANIVEWLSGLDKLTACVDGESLWVFIDGKKTLQFKFHWRNVFFGISTPSVEVFDKVRHTR